MARHNTQILNTHVGITKTYLCHNVQHLRPLSLGLQHRQEALRVDIWAGTAAAVNLDGGEQALEEQELCQVVHKCADLHRGACA